MPTSRTRHGRRSAALGASLLTALWVTASAGGPTATAAGACSPALLVATGGTTLEVVDPSTGETSTSVTVGTTPTDVAVTPDGTTALVTNSGSDTVSVVDTVDWTVRQTLTGFDAPARVAITPDGTTAVVTNADADTISLVDIDSGTVDSPISVGDGPEGIAITPDGTTAYVANRLAGTVSEVDTLTGVVASGTITVGAGPTDVAITPDGATAYVTSSTNGSVSVIDLATDAVTTVSSVGEDLRAVAVTPDGRTAYVADFGSDTVPGALATIDVATGVKETPDIGLGSASATSDVAISPDGRTAYLANDGPGSVSVIDIATRTKAESDIDITDPRGAVALAVSPCPSLRTVIGSDGRTLSISGTGFTPLSSVNLTFAGSSTIGTVTASVLGRFSTVYTVACPFPVGSYAIGATADAGYSATTSVTLQGCETSTPITVDQSTTTTTTGSTSTTATPGTEPGSDTSMPGSTEPIVKADLDVTLGFGEGDDLRSDLGVSIDGTELGSESPYTIVLHSDPVELASGTTDADGTLAEDVLIPVATPAGSHEIRVTVTISEDAVVEASAWFALDEDGLVTAISYDGAIEEEPDTVLGFLPVTGPAGLRILVVALLLGAIGGGTTIAARRRAA